jgi:hypothetical protein
MGRKCNNISGQKFGTLFVKNKTIIKGRYLLWECECECGEICYVSSSDLKRGRVNYCSKCSKNKSEKSTLNILYKIYKRNAIKRNYSFELTIDEFKELINKNCYYCNSKPQQILHKEGMKFDLIYNGIDRKNNKIGYTHENCVTACKFCNIAKRNFKSEDFIKWINQIKNM